jgi:hypothetical protein
MSSRQQLHIQCLRFRDKLPEAVCYGYRRGNGSIYRYVEFGAEFFGCVFRLVCLDEGMCGSLVGDILAINPKSEFSLLPEERNDSGDSGEREWGDSCQRIS